MTTPVLFSQVEVGMTLPPASVGVTSQLVTDYLEVTGGPPAAPGPDGPVVAPPTIAALLMRPALAGLPSPPGGIHAKQRFRFHAPICAGTTVTTVAQVTGKEVRRGRNYVVMETETRDQSGRLLVSGVMTRIWAR